MKSLFEEYGETVLSVIYGTIIVTVFISVFLVEVLGFSVSQTGESVIETDRSGIGTPVGIRSFEVRDILIEKGEEINYNDRVFATNDRGDFGGTDEDISGFVSVYQAPDVSTTGEKEITYVLRYNGDTRFARAKVIVVKEGTLNT